MSEIIAFFATAATTKQDDEGDRFTFDCLRSMQDQVNKDGGRLDWEFQTDRPVGIVTGAQVTRRGLEIIGKIDPQKVPARSGPSYVAPSFFVGLATHDADSGTRMIADVKLTGFGVTTSPTDPHLEPLVHTHEDAVEMRWALAELQMVFVEEADRMIYRLRQIIS